MIFSKIITHSLTQLVSHRRTYTSCWVAAKNGEGVPDFDFYCNISVAFFCVMTENPKLYKCRCWLVVTLMDLSNEQLLMTHLSIIDRLIDQWIDFIDRFINIFPKKKILFPIFQIKKNLNFFISFTLI